MHVYDDLTKGMWGVLFNYLRGYTHTVVFQASVEKLDDLDKKFADNLGTRLPAWKRHQRKSVGLPNCLACALPVPSRPGNFFVVLMLSGHVKLQSLDKESPFRRESWKEGVLLGDFYISTDKRNRGDMTTTWRLTPGCYKGLDSYWRSICQENPASLNWEIERAKDFYPMFGGIRRQLRRLILSYTKLCAHRGVKITVDPEKLPIIRIPSQRDEGV